MVSYAEQGIQDSGRDSDYKIKLKPPQPLDNKSYPSASRIATQRVIKTNRASKQTSMPNAGSLPAATDPAQSQPKLMTKSMTIKCSQKQQWNWTP